MTTALARCLADVDARRDSFKAALSLSRKDLGGTPYASSPVANSGTFMPRDIVDAARQYSAASRDWPYVSIRPVATKIAEQAFHVGTKRKAAAPARGRGKLRTKHYHPLDTRPRFVLKQVEGMEQLDDHPLIDAIESPNRFMTGWALMYCTAFSLYATGRGFWWINDRREKEEGGQLQLWYLPATWVTPIHGEDRPFVGWKVRPPGAADDKAMDLPFEALVYFAFPNPSDPLTTLSPMQTQARAINTDEEIQKAQFAAMVNGIRPGVIITAGRMAPPPNSGIPAASMPRPEMTPEQRQQLIMAIRSAYAGAIHHHDPIIVDQRIESVEPWTTTPVDLDFPAGSALTKARILQGMGTPPLVVGETDGSNRATAYVAHNVYYETVVNPGIVLMSQTITMRLAPLFSNAAAGERLYAWIEKARAFDADLQVQQNTQLVAAKAITKNELREAYDLSPLDEGGDELAGPDIPAPVPPGVGTTKPAPAGGAANRQPKPKAAKLYDLGQPRDWGGRFSPYTIPAADVLARIQRSPQWSGQQIDWDRYAARWGVVGDFEQIDLPITALAKLADTGTLGTSADQSQETIAAKVESGDLNPVVITRPPAERSPLYVVDGTHSLAAAYRRYVRAGSDEDREAARLVRVIVSHEAAKYLGIEIEGVGDDDANDGETEAA